MWSAVLGPIDPARVLLVLLSFMLPWVTSLLKQASQFARSAPDVQQQCTSAACWCNQA